jgi:hypothetical protein
MVQSRVNTLKFPIRVTFFIGGQIGEGHRLKVGVRRSEYFSLNP